MDTRINQRGYEVLRKSQRNRTMILFHVVLAEKILGRPLPRGAEVHHANEIKTDNRLCNLVVCPSRSYHMLLHQRINAKNACGNPNWRKCNYCKKYDAPEKLKIKKQTVYHSNCVNRYNLKRYYFKRYAEVGL